MDGSFYTEAFTHRCLYTGKKSHTTNFYTEKLCFPFLITYLSCSPPQVWCNEIRQLRAKARALASHPLKIVQIQKNRSRIAKCKCQCTCIMLQEGVLLNADTAAQRPGHARWLAQQWIVQRIKDTYHISCMTETTICINKMMGNMYTRFHIAPILASPAWPHTNLVFLDALEWTWRKISKPMRQADKLTSMCSSFHDASCVAARGAQLGEK